MYVDGYVYCRVQHPIKFINNNQDFDLRQPYHLLMATGPADSSKVYWQKNILYSQRANNLSFVSTANIKRHEVEKASSDMKAPASDTSVLYYPASSNILLLFYK